MSRLWKYPPRPSPPEKNAANANFDLAMPDVIEDSSWGTELDFALPDPFSRDEFHVLPLISFDASCLSMDPLLQLPGERSSGSGILVLDSFEFLLHFTTRPGLNNTFNYLTSSDREHSRGSPIKSDPFFINTKPSADLTSGTIKWIFHPLFSRAKEIWEALCYSAREEQNIRGIWSIQDLFDMKCVQLFNPMNIERFLDYYWTRWHANCPVIHKVSLDIAKIPMELFLVLALTGALMSPEPQDLVEARLWLDAAEHLVFRIPWLSGEREMTEDEMESSHLEQLRVLQSVILICFLQVWEGTETAHKRIRQRRYNSVVHVSSHCVPMKKSSSLSGMKRLLGNWDSRGPLMLTSPNLTVLVRIGQHSYLRKS